MSEKLDNKSEKDNNGRGGSNKEGVAENPSGASTGKREEQIDHENSDEINASEDSSSDNPRQSAESDPNEESASENPAENADEGSSGESSSDKGSDNEGSESEDSSGEGSEGESSSSEGSDDEGSDNEDSEGESSDNEDSEGKGSDDEDSSAVGKQPIMQHLGALRKVLINSIVAILVATVVSISFLGDWLVEMLSRPIVKRGIQIIYTAVSEALVTKLKVSLIAGLVFASPYVFYQLWSFLRPALYPKEQKKFRIMFFAIVTLFLLGILFCYGVVYSLALDFFLVAGEGLAQPMLSIDKYIGYLFSFAIPFGLAFQVPVIIYITTSLGLTTTEGLKKARRYVVLGIAVLSAVLTPPDVVSQLLMAVPMLALYELSVFISTRIKPRGMEEA